MRRRKILLAVALSVVVVVLAACSGRVGMPSAPPANPTNNGNPTVEKPQVVALEELVSDLSDGQQASFDRWSNKLLQIQGVINKRLTSSVVGDKRFIGFDIKVRTTDKKTSKKKEFMLSCFLATPLQPGDPKIAKFADGKTVTIRCRLSAQSGDITSVKDCELVE
jgi:hypothetical protein